MNLSRITYRPSVHSFVIGDGNDALRPVDSDSLSLGGLDEVDSEEDLSDGDTDPDYREVQQVELGDIC